MAGLHVTPSPLRSAPGTQAHHLTQAQWAMARRCAACRCGGRASAAAHERALPVGFSPTPQCPHSNGERGFFGTGPEAYISLRRRRDADHRRSFVRCRGSHNICVPSLAAQRVRQSGSDAAARIFTGMRDGRCTLFAAHRSMHRHPSAAAAAATQGGLLPARHRRGSARGALARRETPELQPCCERFRLLPRRPARLACHRKTT
eukprot:351644-Chlamydomonas_euryale.AAC.4